MHHHREGIRQRPIDDSKPYQIIKDLAKTKLSSTKEEQAELNNMEKELEKVLEHYDKRRKIEIPKAKIINGKNEANENIFLNNNIIYNNKDNEAINNKNQSYVLKCNLSEYKRPDNYIIYSSELKNKINATKKIYEANSADNFYLNIRQNPMKIEE